MPLSQLGIGGESNTQLGQHPFNCGTGCEPAPHGLQVAVHTGSQRTSPQQPSGINTGVVLPGQSTLGQFTVAQLSSAPASERPALAAPAVLPSECPISPPEPEEPDAEELAPAEPDPPVTA
ncbi:MAG: hypothetical protein ABJB12_01155 [Pseudomonadota bacterium]